ncbi:MliC family protein [Flavobacterium sp. GP15]|nr:MliC family protein [Flavobacterium sp. GP15]
MGSQSLKDKNGQTLDLTFNNTENTVKAYLNGGEQIDLVGEKPASGIWYKNDQYELRGKGDHLTLTKDGKTVFEN